MHVRFVEMRHFFFISYQSNEYNKSVNQTVHHQGDLVSLSCMGEIYIQILDTHPFSTLGFSEATLEAINPGLHVWAHVFYSWMPEFKAI